MNFDISVLIATHNGRVPLRRAVNSALASDAPDCRVQVCICDDASTNDTYEVMQSLTSDHVKITRHEKNLGTAQGYNSAAAIADGKYFIILGDDDWFEGKALAGLLKALRQFPGRKFAYGATKYWGERHDVVAPPKFQADDFWHQFASLYAYLYPRKAWDEGCRYSDIITLENGRGLGVCDYDFALQLIDKGYTGISMNNFPVLNYNLGTNSSQTAMIYARQAQLVAGFRQRWPKWKGMVL